MANVAEAATGLDLDGDGDVGVLGSDRRSNAWAAAEVLAEQAQEESRVQAATAEAEAALQAAEAEAASKAAARKSLVTVAMGTQPQLSGVEWARRLLADKDKRKRVCVEEFSIVDVNQNGTLDQQEVFLMVARICGRSGLELPQTERCAELFALCDKNSDGALEVKEFQTYFRAVLESAVKKGDRMAAARLP
mmetsp:Transcript_47767/g.159222  ORF Transcript_47767/g.159222 Transcript_47767/m.159222 type:complete len:192 (+) Transcript_47767:697-1272(+)